MAGRLSQSLKAAALLLSSVSASCQAAPTGAREPANGAAQAIAAAARPVRGAADDHAELLKAAGPATRILLGESTHGTHEFYRERARLTERLVLDHAVNAVAIEGDWSPTYRVNLYVRGLGTDRTAAEALRGYSRFPEWMWRNAEFRDFVERLRAINMARPAGQRVGLYGMDVYDMFEAADAVVAYLRQSDAGAANQARDGYRCFTRHGRTTAQYGEATLRGADCSRAAAAGVAAVARLPRPADPAGAERHFAAVRSAASVAAAEEYFRTAYRGSLAWNVRDQQMARNVEEIAAHVQALSGRPGKVVMWSHNTHSGDARATFAADRGELNLGQLMRQRHGQAAFLVGFFTYEGTVFAAPDWDRPGRIYTVRPALPGSYAATFRSAGQPNFSLLLRGNQTLGKALGGPMLERAIGVVYRPETERSSHYFDARLAEQFDAAIFFDRSRAVTPLPR